MENAVELDSSILYHYTDAVGLAGIVSPSSWPVRYDDDAYTYGSAAKLWASDVRYMNDTSELAFGAEIFRESLAAASADRAVPDEMRSVFGVLAQWFDPERVLDWPLRCFATSFCADGDLLSQWRGYAGGVGGYAIGFSRAAVERACAFHPKSTALGNTPFPARLQRVIYGREAASAWAEKIVSSMAASASKFVHDMDGNLKPFDLSVVVFREILALKESAFSEENEWRLSAVNELRYPANIRAGRAGLLPYLEMAINLRPDESDVLPGAIERLVVGPGPHQLAQVVAARELLSINGHAPAVVVPSKVPFRG